MIRPAFSSRFSKSTSWNRLLTGVMLSAAWTSPLLGQGFGPLGTEFRVNTTTAGGQTASSVARDADGNFVVVWRSPDGGGDYGIFGQRFDATGAAQGSEFQVNTYTTGYQGIPSVAMASNGSFVVAWAGYGRDASPRAIFAQRFDAAGVAQGAELQVNTYTTEFVNEPALAIDAAGNFVVVWQRSLGVGTFIEGQRFDATGAAQGPEFQVNADPGVSPGPISAAMAPDGRFVVVWERYFFISARLFDASGTAQGSEFRVDSAFTNDQAYPSAAMDANGSFVVAWQVRYGADGSSNGVFARLFGSDGLPAGPDFQVNTFTTSSQALPAAAMDATGSFVVAWESGGNQDGGGYGVFAQRFDAGGAALGAEFRVNTYTSGGQGGPAVATDGSGNFVVTWYSNLQDGSNTGIFAQRFGIIVPPSLSIDDVFVAEGNAGTATVSFSVALSQASAETVTVAYATADGSATAGSDYLATSGTLTFAPGATTQPVDVTVNGDLADEPTGSGPSETFFVNLSGASNATIEDGQGQGTILNDDAASPAPPGLDPVQGGRITVGATQTLTGANFTAGTVIKLFVNTGASIDDVSGPGGFAPSAFTFNTLTWDIPPTVPLGQGFGSIFVVNTDQGFTQSNTQYALLYGDPADNIPTITSVGGTPLSTTLDPGIPVAHADEVVETGTSVPIAGTGFNAPGVNVFAAPDVGADPAPTTMPCPVSNYGPIFPGGSSTSFGFTMPAAPAGPVNFQAVNDPYTGNVQSNSVSAVAGARPSITSVFVDQPSPGEVTVLGAGFSCLSVINLFNLQGGSTVVNLGGLTGGGQRVIPLQFISAGELRFPRPAGAQAGPAFVEVLNPPFIPFSSSGNDLDGAFSFP